MKTLRFAVMLAALAVATPLSAQQPDSLLLELQAAADTLGVEAVRSRGFIRGAETQLSKVVRLQAKADSLIALMLIGGTTPPPPPPPPADSTAPPPPPPPPPGSNMPAGLSVVFEDDFEYVHRGNQGVPPGWDDIGNWRPDWWEIDGALCGGLSGNGGTYSIVKNLGGSFDELYVAFDLWYEPGFEHNDSEKAFYVNPDTPGYYMFEHLWGSEVLYSLQGPPLGEFLEANQMPRRPGDNVPDAPPPPDGQWYRIEFYTKASTGEARWWGDSELHGAHTNVPDIPRANQVKVDDTWGGGGNKQDGRKRRCVDNVRIAVR